MSDDALDPQWTDPKGFSVVIEGELTLVLDDSEVELRPGSVVVQREHLLCLRAAHRPTRAVRAMEAWAHDGSDSEATRRFYPTLHKRNLFALGYIAAQSVHSTGTAIDLTLIQLSAA